MRAAALLSGAALSAAVLTACDGGATEAPFLVETSPTPTGTQALEAQLESFREFAVLIEEAVTSGDGTLLAQQAITPNVRFSTGDIDGRASPDSVRNGFERLISEAVANESDEFGGGQAVLYALARRAEEPGDDENRYQAIISAIVPRSYGTYEPYRSIAVYEFAFRDGRWRLVTVSIDPHTGETIYPFPGAWLRRECEICFDHWERWEGTP